MPLFAENYTVQSELPRPIIRDPFLPLVSIVTPSYNQGKYIRETIESILTQDYPNIEYWVIDAGSTDQTLTILREYESDPRFHWISEPDRGQSDAINKGWRRSQGEILAWLCSDDVYCPHAIRTQTRYLIEHPDVVAVYGDAIAMSADGERVRKDWARPFAIDELLRIDFIPQTTVFLRRSLIASVGMVDTSLHFAMDHDYWLRTSFFGAFNYSPGEIAKYRLHDKSKGVSQIARFNPEIEAVVERYFQNPQIPDSVLKKKARIYADVMLMISINYVRANQFSQSFKYYRMSLQYSLFRPRVFWLVARFLETRFHLPFVNQAIESWFYWRSKVR